MANINWFNKGQGIPYIVDSGDGWVKYSDGRMECFGRHLTSGSSGQRIETISFPQSFSEIPTITTTYEGATSTGNFYGFVIKGTPSTTRFQCRAYGGLYMNWRAIGKWQ